jgi:hypothetical protein
VYFVEQSPVGLSSGASSSVRVRPLNVTVFCVVSYLVSTIMSSLKVKNGQEYLLQHLIMLVKKDLACLQQMGYMVL